MDTYFLLASHLYLIVKKLYGDVTESHVIV